MSHALNDILVEDVSARLRRDGVCGRAYIPGKPTSTLFVLCLQPAETCSLHSDLATKRADAQEIVDVLSEYEDTHGPVADGWVCLSDALCAAKEAMAR